MSKGQQFGRYVEVEIRDFNSKTKTIIGNDFEIEFDYFKTVDQTTEDDSGQIRIYGLTPERIESLQFEGGEVVLRCGYLMSSIETLFVANISRLYSQNTDNTTLTTIDCSANLLNHYYTGGAVNNNLDELPMYAFLENLSETLGNKKMSFVADRVPSEHFDKVFEFLHTFPVTAIYAGSAHTVVDNVCQAFGMTYFKKEGDGYDTIGIFEFTDIGLKNILTIISNGYKKSSYVPDKNKKADFISLMKADEESLDIIVLDYGTGLIEAKTEYKISHAYADQESVTKQDDSEDKDKKKEVKKAPLISNNNTNTDNPFVSNSELKGLKIKQYFLKGTNILEPTANGQVRKATAHFAHVVSSYVGVDNIKYFSAFNDHSHRNSKFNHPKGLAFDFVLKNTSNSNAAVVASNLRKLAKEYGFNVKVGDEYNFPNQGTTAPHLHVSVYGYTGSGGSVANNTMPNTYSPTRRITIRVNKEYKRVKALLNPLAKPQSMVAVFKEYLEDDNPIYNSVDADGRTTVEVGDQEVGKVGRGATYNKYRIRSAAYKGNNKRNDWVMDLYCEDTEQKEYLSQEQLAALIAKNPTENVDIYIDESKDTPIENEVVGLNETTSTETGEGE